MKMLKIGMLALVVGVAGGAVMGGMGAKSDILAQRAVAHADSLAAHGVEEAQADDHGAGSDLDQVVDSAGDVVEGGHEERVDPAGDQQQPAAGAGVHAVDPDSLPHAVTEMGRSAGVEDSVAVVAQIPAAQMPGVSDAIDMEGGATKLAKIFGAMKPADAAAVLQEMGDHEVKAILQQMSDRKAAQILGAFTPERAATLSRAVLVSGRAAS